MEEGTVTAAHEAENDANDGWTPHVGCLPMDVALSKVGVAPSTFQRGEALLEGRVGSAAVAPQLAKSIDTGPVRCPYASGLLR